MSLLDKDLVLERVLKNFVNDMGNEDSCRDLVDSMYDSDNLIEGVVLMDNFSDWYLPALAEFIDGIVECIMEK